MSSLIELCWLPALGFLGTGRWSLNDTDILRPDFLFVCFLTQIARFSLISSGKVLLSFLFPTWWGEAYPVIALCSGSTQGDTQNWMEVVWRSAWWVQLHQSKTKLHQSKSWGLKLCLCSWPKGSWSRNSSWSMFLPPHALLPQCCSRRDSGLILRRLVHILYLLNAVVLAWLNDKSV